MPGLPSSEELHTEILNFLNEWGKEFNEDDDNLIMSSTGTGKFKIIRDENPITFEAILDSINVLNSCSLVYEIRNGENGGPDWVLFTLIYPHSKHFYSFLNASKVYVGLENHLILIAKSINTGLWDLIDKYFPNNCVPVLVDPTSETVLNENISHQVIQTDREKTWNNLHFRSESEIRIAQALDKVQGVLFFPNAKARLGHPKGRENREPDFLVCYRGKWGILEVDGQKYHPSASMDHARDRLFKLHGVSVIEHFDATECYEDPERVVKQFLYLLSQN